MNKNEYKCAKCNELIITGFSNKWYYDKNNLLCCSKKGECDYFSKKVKE